jgi:hypothetical protein
MDSGVVEKGGRVSRVPNLRFRTAFAVFAIFAGCGVSPASLRAQTIRGTLLERDSNRPINLGFVVLLTESGDSITSTITNRMGRFEVASPDPGNFLLLAAALGHRETTVGVFELGEGGELSVEFRIPVEPLTLDGLLVQAGRVGQLPGLVLNGFSRRMQQGLGRFITPADIALSPAFRTADLFVGMLGVSVDGERVQVRTGGRTCTPQIWIDGLPQSRDADFALDFIIPLEAIAAVEVYRRATEVPLQYGGSRAGCGVFLFWTKTGDL